MLTDLKTTDLLDQFASGAPVPGGGSAGALIGAVAAALVVMVATLTAGKKNMVHLKGRMQAIADQAGRLQTELRAAVDRDADAYTAVLAAVRLPKADARQMAARQQSMDEAMVHAAQVPLATARSAMAVMELAAEAVADGLPSARSDALVALMAARTAVRAGVCNVRINLGSIADAAIAQDLAKQAADLEAHAAGLEAQVVARSAL